MVKNIFHLVRKSEYLYLTKACMQLTFAIITAAIVCGAFAERMKFSAMLVFMFFWHFLVYCPVAHRYACMLWCTHSLASSVL
jgi:ammonia channel protein AmtB